MTHGPLGRNISITKQVVITIYNDPASNFSIYHISKYFPDNRNLCDTWKGITNIIQIKITQTPC